jgi:subtilisin-like proprotein convertase family protein
VAPCTKGHAWLLNAKSGLTLDSTPEPREGSSPVLFHVHGMPWQHWRISPAGRGTVTITAEAGGHDGDLDNLRIPQIVH